MGIRYEQEWVAWCEEVRDYINEHLQDR